MKFGQQLVRELSGTSESFQAASIDYKQLKKSIKRIENELAGFGLDANLLKELLSANNAEVNGADGAESESATAKPARLKTSSSAASLAGRKSNGSLNKRMKKKRKQSRARAVYELAGTVDNPVPRIKLVFSSASSESASSDEGNRSEDLYDRLVAADSGKIVEVQDESIATSLTDTTPGDSQQEDGEDVDEDEDDENVGLPSPGDRSEQTALIGKLYGHNIVPQHLVTPPGTPPGSPKAFGSAQPGEYDEDGIGEASFDGPHIMLGQREAAVDADGEGDDRDETASLASTLRQAKLNGRKRTRRPRRHRRELTIDLEYGSEFFTLLNQALSSLTELLQAEKQTFLDAVRQLAKVVSQAASPARNKSDLYAWREVFALWVEAQIFESDSERNRGERSVAEVEKRLDWFVDQVGRRKLAKKMKKKESRKSLERFVELNQELLQLKRIGVANREAARKILKKHDKRLGLSASQEFPEFVGKQRMLSAGESEKDSALIARTNFAQRVTSSEMTTLVFAGLTTLPHALLTSFTDILLPIIPQIDDYACLICGDLAWRPIALNCGHKFCVRCLVKMQKRGQDACPACRAPVVMSANKDNLDIAMMSFQQKWFPREIKAKDKENKKEIEAEVMEEMDLNVKCVVM